MEVYVKPKRPESKRHKVCFPLRPKKKLEKPTLVDLMAHEMWWGRALKKGVVVLCDRDGKELKTKKEAIEAAKAPAKAKKKGGK